MCLVLVAYQMHPIYPIIIAANRDEYYQRATASAHYWDDCPEILAGRDLEKMGTWMGVTKTGRFAALTNYRDPKEETKGKRSRGELVADSLQYKGNTVDYMKKLAESNDLYPGYNLLTGNREELYYYSNISKELIKVDPGVHGVSNHLLNTSWPKVQRGKNGMKKMISESNQDKLIANLFSLLQHSDPAPDSELPSTGISLEWERLLSPMFIKSDHYGTRCSTVLLLSNQDIHYVERVYNNGEMNERSFHIPG